MRNRYFFLFDLLLIPIAVYVSYLLRLETVNHNQYWRGIALLSILGVGLICASFWRLDLYSRYWRYASVEEMVILTVAVIVAALGAGVLGWIGLRALGFTPASSYIPRSIPLIFALLALVVTAGPRVLFRASAHVQPRFSNREFKRFSKTGESTHLSTPIAVLIAGAGDAGAMLLREIQRNPQLKLDVVGFIDDDVGKHDIRIYGVPVLGSRDAIPEIASDYKIKQVLIAMPTASGKAIRDIVSICEKTGVKTRIMPGIYELIDGTVRINQLREVRIDDLLRRDPIKTDVNSIKLLLANKRVLVTGGGGSIGSELCRQIARCNPSQLIVLGHGENSIFNIEQELKNSGTHVDFYPVIADIRSPERVRWVFDLYKPQIVFHAAAHKHVPLMESNPTEALTNNIIGTRVLLDAAVASNTERFVMISTDKAVNPSSVMGASKRVAELLVHRAAQKSGNPYVAVRFGNVLGSRGSVVQTFKNQIELGGPIRVTDPEMRRYFMTIPEAVQLVLQAAVLGTGGEVFMFDMGEPVKIVDLARDMIRLSGLELGRDIDITYTGARPGEKMYEELFLPNEQYARTHHEKIFIVTSATQTNSEDLDERLSELIAAVQNNPAQVVNLLQNIVPEFRRNHNDTSQ
jgi:FlaA1/EpsC-like NDP-sugar epimerase